MLHWSTATKDAQHPERKTRRKQTSTNNIRNLDVDADDAGGLSVIFVRDPHHHKQMFFQNHLFPPYLYFLQDQTEFDCDWNEQRVKRTGGCRVVLACTALCDCSNLSRQDEDGILIPVFETSYTHRNGSVPSVDNQLSFPPKLPSLALARKSLRGFSSFHHRVLSESPTGTI